MHTHRETYTQTRRDEMPSEIGKKTKIEYTKRCREAQRLQGSLRQRNKLQGEKKKEGQKQRQKQTQENLPAVRI